MTRSEHRPPDHCKALYHSSCNPWSSLHTHVCLMRPQSTEITLRQCRHAAMASGQGARHTSSHDHEVSAKTRQARSGTPGWGLVSHGHTDEVGLEHAQHKRTAEGPERRRRRHGLAGGTNKNPMHLGSTSHLVGDEIAQVTLPKRHEHVTH